ncbi:hypothetical protein [Edaphobacter bradus]|uniref:hypothetical protein n=1 Tax=Edaphobacter bradus TaxID=2259016 RepID=UPI0021DF94C1|nr:hypothetical protein [Edaphobacter bradus]
MKKRTILWWNLSLVLPAAVSLYAALRNALKLGHSQDFQWSGASLALHHIDPYRQILLHNPGHLILLSQVPNYLHELYLLFLPLGAMSFASARVVWLVLNGVFMLGVLFLLRRIYGLDKARTLLLALLLIVSTPFRIVVGAGTESLLELFLFCLVFDLKGPLGRGLALGFSYLKYSFSPVLFLYLALRREYRVLAVSLAPPLLGLLGMWSLVHGNLLTLAIEPFAVSRVGVTPGLGDLMVLVHGALDHVLPVAFVGELTYAVAFLASAGYAFFFSRQNGVSRQREAAALAVASLMFFPHLTYDYIFLTIPLAACLTGAMTRAKVLILSAICLVLYGIKALPVVAISPATKAWRGLAVFLLLSGILYLVSRRGFEETTQDQSGDLIVEATA